MRDDDDEFKFVNDEFELSMQTTNRWITNSKDHIGLVRLETKILWKHLSSQRSKNSGTGYG